MNYHSSSSSVLEGIILCTILFLSLSVEATKAFVIESKSWQYKGHHIGYEEAKRVVVGTTTEANTSGSVNTSISDNNGGRVSDDCDNQPILVLNGFGVGSFHQHRLMPNLISNNANESKESKNSNNSNDNDTNNEIVRTVYGIDYLGQGRSWPIDCDDGNSINEKGLIYSIDMWADQIIDFIETIILPNHDDTSNNDRTKVHLIGNSVGGHLSAILAAKRPDLIESICLLNATPVWGLNLPGWDGQLPPPFLPRKIGRFLFDKIRDLGTIEQYLESAYSRREAFDDELMKQIRGCTEGKGGHAAFASILWSPPTGHDKDFYSILTQLECDVLLIFGKNDPWCTPAFAKRMYQSLQKRHDANDNDNDNSSDTKTETTSVVERYVELDNVGHCPNHEAPEAVGLIASRWMSTNQRHRRNLSLLNKITDADGETKAHTDEVTIEEPWGDIVAREVKDDEISLSLMDRIITSMV